MEDIGNYVPRVGSSLKKLLGCGDESWYTWFVGWIKYSINTPNTIFQFFKRFAGTSRRTLTWLITRAYAMVGATPTSATI